MNIQGVSLYKNNAINARNNSKNATPIFKAQVDSFQLSNKNNVSFKGDTIDKVRYGIEANYHIQYARNLMDDARDVRVDGYIGLAQAEEVKKESEVTKIQARRVYDEVTKILSDAKKTDYASQRGDGDSAISARIFYRGLNAGITMEERDVKNRLLRKAVLDDKQLTVAEYESDDEYTLYKFDNDTGILRIFGDEVKGDKNYFKAEEYHLYSKDGKLEVCAKDCKRNKDGFGSSEELYTFLNNFGLIVYNQNHYADPSGLEASDIEFKYALTEPKSQDKEPRMELLSCALKPKYAASGAQSADRIFTYHLNNQCLAEFTKGLSIDKDGNEKSKLVLKFNDDEYLEEVAQNQTLCANGDKAIGKLFYYRNDSWSKSVVNVSEIELRETEKPLSCYIDYKDIFGGVEEYKKRVLFD